MDGLTIVLILALIVAAIVAAPFVIGSMKRKRKQRDQANAETAYDQRQQEAKERRKNACPVDLQIGSTVRYDGPWYKVNGKVSYREGKYEWVEYRFKNIDNRVKAWLCIEKDEGEWLVTLWHDVNLVAADLPASPSDQFVIYDGEKYLFSESGQAGYKVEGETDLEHDSGSVEYFDYEGRSGAMLSYERYDGGVWEVSAGVKCNIDDIEDFPPVPE